MTGDSRAWLDEVDQVIDRCLAGLGGTLKGIKNERKPVPGRMDLVRQNISLQGPAIEKAFEISSWTLRWFLPTSKTLILPSGETMAFSLKALPRPGILKNEKGKDRKLSPKDVADLGNFYLCSSWSSFVENCWKSLGQKVKQGDSVRIEWFLALEGILNSLLTCSKTRMAAGLTPLTGNLLRQIEDSRKVQIGPVSYRGDGFLRRPHSSHKGRLCPYQTPESERIGLQLFLATGADLDGQEIAEGRAQLSFAVGLVPHSRHSDGPRLLMGGKNLKQAESGIAGEPARIPGDYEGRHLPYRSIAALQHQEGRFYPFLGINALVAVMPWQGFTYEDGLVLSRNFAQKLVLADSELEQREIIYSDIAPQGISDAKALQREADALVGESYSYDDLLPLPQTLLAQGFRPRPYRQNSPARLTSLTIRLAQGRPKGSGEGRNRAIEIRLLYRFRLRRPLAIGDKITGRHGNKGVVTAILDKPPQARIGDQWHDIDLIISPCSIIGRKNFGQIAEMVQSLTTDGLAPETDKNWRSHLFSLKKLGADEGGRFEIDCGDGRKGRAFCGYQYICRLHHHSAKKLQARGANGPKNRLLNEPLKAGTLSGQTLGEMENWALLSHDGTIDGLDFLRALRRDHSPSGKTWQVFRTLLRSFGLSLIATDEGMETRMAQGEALSLQEAMREKLPAVETELAQGRPLSPEDRLYVITDTESGYWENLSRGLVELGLANPKKLPYQSHLRFLADLFEQSSTSLPSQPVHPLASALRELAEAPPMRFKKGKKLNLDGLLLFLAWAGPPKGPAFGFPFTPALLEIAQDTTELRRVLSALNDLAQQGQERERKTRAFLRALGNYREHLLKLLKGKNGLLRRHLLGRRYARTGRAVIVPRPELGPDETLLPTTMIARMLEGSRLAEKLGRFAGFDEGDWLALRKGQSDERQLKRLNQALGEHPFWVLLIRQPSLHRHNIQAFRAYSHDEAVIGFPPLATPGYNADFDGDTMAVVVPPGDYVDLVSWTLPYHPGFLGNGSVALSCENDLALGWHALEKRRKEFWLTQARLDRIEGSIALSDLLASLCRSTNPADLAQRLKELQSELAQASTASCSLGPLELEALYNDERLKQLRGEAKRIKATEPDEEPRVPPRLPENGWPQLRKEMEKTVQAFLDIHPEGDLACLIGGKAKGKLSDLVAAMGCLGYQEEAANVEGWGDPDERSKAWITECLWEGLSEDNLFLYSYESRKAMASKKLLVAQGGYLSRRLAEGLYDSRIESEDCRSQEGLTLSYDRQNHTLSLSFGARALPFFSGDDAKALRRHLERVAWGRWVPALNRLLDGDDLKALIGFWRNNLDPDRQDLADLLADQGTLTLRSPLTCRIEGRGFCRRCLGADIALKPFDKPTLQKKGRPVGLDAAMAIGERGTQLAMKAFHSVGSGGSSIKTLEKLLLSKRTKGTAQDELRGLLALLQEAGDNLPQALVHFEVALKAPQGLIAWANERQNRWVAALAYEQAGEKLLPWEQDTGKTLKSAVLLASICPEERGEPS